MTDKQKEIIAAFTDEQKRAWNIAIQEAVTIAYDVWKINDLGHQNIKASNYINSLQDLMISVKPDGAPDDWSINEEWKKANL